MLQKLTTTFILPENIVSGLTNGEYERIGGVIRNSSDKRIVLWLRENSMSPNILSKIPGLPLIPPISMLNLGVSAIGFSVILSRLNELDEKLKSVQLLLDKIDRKIDLSFQSKFRAALDLAKNSMSMTDLMNRHASAHQAIVLFRQIEPIYLSYLDKELELQSQAADEYLIILCLAYIAEFRCYLEIGESMTALKHFQSWIELLRPRFHRYLEILLTSNPSAYLDPQFKDQIDLRRLTRIYQWIEPEQDENSVFEKLREKMMRWPQDRISASGHKWVDTLPPAIIARHEVQGGFWGNRQEMAAEAMNRLPEIMSRMESMIETHQRLESYQSEIQGMVQLGLNFRDWTRLAPSKSSPVSEQNLLYVIPAKPLELSGF